MIESHDRFEQSSYSYQLEWKRSYEHYDLICPMCKHHVPTKVLMRVYSESSSEKGTSVHGEISFRIYCQNCNLGQDIHNYVAAPDVDAAKEALNDYVCRRESMWAAMSKGDAI